MSREADTWLRPVGDGCVIDVWAVPGASRSGVTGLHGDAVRVRVAAPPEHGAANRELLRLIARVLGVRAGDVTLEAGATGRRKRVHVRGLDASGAARRLVQHLSVDTPPGHN